jgi:hypothetical protein
MPSNKIVHILILVTLLFSSTLTGKTALTDPAEPSKEDLSKSQEEIFGQTFKNKYHNRSESYDYVHAMSLERDLKLDSSSSLYYMLSSISVEYSVNLVMPFSPIGNAFIDYMVVVKELIHGQDFNKETYSNLIISLMKAFKSVLASVKPTTVEKDGENYLGYIYQQEPITSLNDAVAALFGDKGLQEESENCHALKKSFETLNPLSLFLKSEDDKWKNSNVETAILQLDLFEVENGSDVKTVAPGDVVSIVSTLLKIASDQIKYGVAVNTASFYPQMKNTSKLIYTLLLTTVSVDLIFEAKKFIDAFRSLADNAQMNYNSHTNKLRVLIFEANSKETFQEKASAFLKYITDADVGDDQGLKDLIGGLSFSVQEIVNALKGSVPQSIDGAYKDYDFTTVAFPRIIKNQDLDKETWTNLKEIHGVVHSQENFLRLNKSSEISIELLNFFYHVIRLMEEYEQSAKLRAHFFELFDIAKNFITTSVPQSKTSPQLIVVGYYQYQRIPCFALQHHLAEFVGLMEELIYIDSKDTLTKKVFVSALVAADKILNKFGRRITYTKGHCFEIFHGLEENEDGFLAQFISNDGDIPTTEFNFESVPGQSSFPQTLDFNTEVAQLNTLVNTNPVNVEEAKPAVEEINRVGEPRDSNDLNGDDLSFLNKKEANEPNRQRLTESEFDEEEPETNDPLTHLSRTNSNPDPIEREPLLTKTYSDPASGKKPLKIIRRIIILEVLDCDECLNDANLRIFVESLKHPFSKI